MLKKVRVKIETDRYTLSASPLFSGAAELFVPPAEEPVAETDHAELLTEARLRDDGTRVFLSYEEGVFSRMEKTTTTVSFAKAEPGLLSVIRTGGVRTSLLFEKGRRHTCIYQTPIMPFEVCVATRNVHNDLAERGTLFLDYLIEIRGAEAEHTRFRLSILPDFKAPLSEKAP